MKILFSSLMLLVTLTVSCASRGGTAREKEGSSPLNGKESIAYQKALLRLAVS